MRPNPTRLLVLVCALASLDLALYLAAVPLLPRWERELGLSKSQAGVVLGAYGVSVLLGSLPLGLLADRLGAKRLTAGAAVLFALAAPALALADGFWELVAVRAAQGLFSAVSWTAGLAWIFAASPAARRGRSMALVNASAMGATLLGPVLGGPIVAAFGFLPAMTAFGCVVAVLGVWALLEPEAHVPSGGVQSPIAALGLSVRSWKVRAAFVGILFVSTAVGTVQLLAPLHLAGKGFSDADVGWVFTAAALLALGENLALTRIADRIDGRGAMIAAIVFVGLANALLGAGLSLAGYVAATVALPLATGPLFLFSYTLCARGAQEVGTGSGVAMGALNTLWATGSLVAPIAAGTLAGVGGDALSFGAVAGVAVVAAVAVDRARRAERASAPSAW